MENNDLEKLFSGEQLEPSKKFEKQLLNRLSKDAKNPKIWFFYKLSSVLVITLMLIGVALYQPNSDNLSNTVLLKELYQKALADELPESNDVNFWKIIGGTTYGAQAPLCTNTESGVSYQKLSLLYKNNQESAYFNTSTEQYTQPYMNYSDDSDIPAYDDSVFTGANSYVVQQYLANTYLTNENGNKLTDNATTEVKTEGSYLVYAKLETPSSDVKNFVDGCNNLQIKIEIDAETGLYESIYIYNVSNNSKLDEANLSFSLFQQIETASFASFSDVDEEFISEGFDLETARSNTLNNSYSRIVNKEAGFEFWYDKPLLGKSELKLSRDNNGNVTSYQYVFLKHPEVTYIIYTSFARDVINLEEKIVLDNLEVVTRNTGEFKLPGYGEVTSTYLTAKNDTTKYQLSITGSTDIIAVYIEAPLELGVSTKVDKNAPDFPYIEDKILSMIVSVFPPNTDPPSGL